MSKPVIYETLFTPRADLSQDECPWNVYPRPQMQRDSFICLNGKWNFSVTKSDDIPASFNKTITVPFPPESALSGLEMAIKQGDRLFYERSITLPEGFVRDKLFLHFGAVDQIADVFVNGVQAVHHEGGYIPFTIDITDLVADSSFNICVRVRDDNSDLYPYGKQKPKRGGMWYTPVSGIWQTVWLESVPTSYIESVRIEQTANYAKFEIKSSAEKAFLTVKETGENFEFKDGFAEFTPTSPHRWSPEDPYLYHYEITTENDSVKGYFALREIGYTKDRDHPMLTLNGDPYFFSGLLDQGYFPDGIFTPPSHLSYEDDILAAKELGFNMLRKHIKIEPLVFYYLCDKHGMVVFQDMVNNSDYSFIQDTAFPTVGIKRQLPLRHRSAEKRRIFIEQMKGTADLLYNSPSVLEYTIFNEGWGQFLPDKAYRFLKSLDPSRIIDSTSGWFKEHLSDVDSRHIYFKLPRVKKTDGKPLFLSEFGGYSLRCDGHLFGSKNYGYSLYRNEQEFEEAFVKLYEEGVLPLIDSVGLSATVYTQLSDVEDETNGLLTYDRKKVKISKETARRINKMLMSAVKNG